MGPVTPVLVFVGSVALLVLLTVGIGAAMDTEAQRREWRRIARARRRLREEQLAVDLIDTTIDERQLCQGCPYRSTTDG